MQYYSRLAATMKCKSNWVLLSSSILHNHNRILPLGCCRAATSTPYRTADPAIHAEDPEGINADEAAKAAAAQKEQKQKPATIEVEGSIKDQSVVKPATQRKLESWGVNPPIDPITQQKRHYCQSIMKSSTPGGSASAPPPPPPPLEDFCCVGVDGTPLPMDEEQSQEDEQKEYYKYHKPSPLSEIEMVDTRKPITRATDGGASAGYFGDEVDVIVWSEEQLDTAEEALRRATLIWKESAMRDDPDSPQARALRRALLEQQMIVTNNQL
ncbi:hypothetical protein BVC80_1543g310 [Macleaya cordata]|uniref:Uncharacterized protein n=1 Tax=Macleaya cordata TaxID=56857 RepID=A0A200R290_MACCD|nr:hypothetical protein BVC80_1543g310 [Macleaya cordata]